MPPAKPWDWEQVKQAAYEWMADEAAPATTLFVPPGTDEVIMAMCGDIYDVKVVEWPVEFPTFGNDRPFGPACVDRSVDSTLGVMRGEPNTRGLPFPLYSDLGQRDCQFRFMKQSEADQLGRRIYQIADWTLRQLLLWSVIQRVSPTISTNAFRAHWDSFNMGALSREDVEYCQALFSKMQPGRNPQQQTVGDLWIVTSMSPSKVLSPRIKSYIKPVWVTSDEDRQTAGRQFGPDDRIFYTQWNPKKLIEAVQRCRVPSLLVPKHQLSPKTECRCLLCQRGGFNESSWWDINESLTSDQQRTGRLSMSDPQNQSLMRRLPSQIHARIANMDPEEYRQYLQYLLMQQEMTMAAKYLTANQARKLLGIEP